MRYRFVFLCNICDSYVEYVFSIQYLLNCSVCSHLHEADAAGQEVHEKREERGHVVDLCRLCDAAQRL